MKYLVLILHLISGDQVEVNSNKTVWSIVNMLNNNPSSNVWTQKGIYITHNNHETWVNLDHVEYIEKIWREDDGF